MQTLLAVVPAAAVATTSPGWLYGLSSVLIGGAVVPFLLSVVPDAVALLLQRRRWQLLVGLAAATAAALGALRWTLALAMSTDSGYLVNWPELAQLLFVVGLVVALWHGLPRVMRAVGRRRQEDREHAGRNAPVEPAGTVPADVAPATTVALDPQPA